jgi:hypothetical protein
MRTTMNTAVTVSVNLVLLSSRGFVKSSIWSDWIPQGAFFRRRCNRFGGRFVPGRPVGSLFRRREHPTWNIQYPKVNGWRSKSRELRTVRYSMFGVRCSMFGVRCSRSMSDVFTSSTHRFRACLRPSGPLILAG